ncbi:MAG: transcriptional regulator, partial [Acidobacteria bacterium]|nr:transcriptional regulator [Acidobacteriota bacterium]
MERPSARTTYTFGEFRLDPVKRLLWRGAEPVPLLPKAMDMLLVLLTERGRVLEKDELLSRIWPDTIVEEANLSVTMSALRKALGESAQEHRSIVTIPRRGYQFVGEVSQNP